MDRPAASCAARAACLARCVSIDRILRARAVLPWTVVSKVEKFVFGLAGAMAVDEARLRASLREVFARLDIDGSGAVSTREMRRMTDELGMEMSDEASECRNNEKTENAGLICHGACLVRTTAHWHRRQKCYTLTSLQTSIPLASSQ